jgi:hypothetical protein
VGDATWGWRPGAHTGVELIAAGDLVETQAAINRGVAYGFYGASIEQQLAHPAYSYWTGRLSALYGRQ